MDMAQLNLFHLIAENKSFSTTAKKVNCSQPAVSQQIKALEKAMGVTLFKRAGVKRIELTEDGKIFKNLSQNILLDFSSLKEKLQSARHDGTGTTLKVCCDGISPSLILAKTISQHPSLLSNLKINILRMNFEQTIGPLMKDDLDFCISSLSETPGNIIYKEFFKSEFMMMINKKNPLYSKEKITLKDLQKVPLILPSAGTSFREYFDDFFQSKGINPTVVAELDPFPQIAKMFVLLGVGVSFIPRLWLEFLNFEDVGVRNVSHILGYQKFGIAYKQGKTFSYSASLLLNYLAPGTIL